MLSRHPRVLVLGCLAAFLAGCATPGKVEEPEPIQFDRFVDQFPEFTFPAHVVPSTMDQKKKPWHRLRIEYVQGFLHGALNRTTGGIFAPEESHYAPVYAIGRVPNTQGFTALVYRVGLPDWNKFFLATFTPDGRLISQIELASAPTATRPYRAGIIHSNLAVEVRDNVPVAGPGPGYPPPDRRYYAIQGDGRIVDAKVLRIERN